jgi:hypothetical protein
VFLDPAVEFELAEVDDVEAVAVAFLLALTLIISFC